VAQFAGQATQLVIFGAFVATEYVAVGHGVQDVEALGTTLPRPKYPALHVQAAASELVLVLIGQTTQVEVVAFCVVEYVPVAHFVHDALPVVGL
jgi:hypothetical protein